jgi:CBS-domain-containing membrane protein
MARRPFSDKLTHFRAHAPSYVIQSLLATGVMLVAMWLIKLGHRAMDLEGAVIVASIGSSSFAVFAIPGSRVSQPRSVLGGPLIGLGCGLLWNLAAGPLGYYDFVAFAAAAGSTMFLMVVTDTEHPPACGVALAIAMRGWHVGDTTAVVMSAVVLATAHKLLRPYLRDLA